MRVVASTTAAPPGPAGRTEPMSSVLIWDASVRGVGCLCSKTGGGPTGNQAPRGGRGPGALTMATGLGVVAGGWETGLPRPPPRRCGRGERLGLRETRGAEGAQHARRAHPGPAPLRPRPLCLPPFPFPGGHWREPWEPQPGPHGRGAALPGALGRKPYGALPRS